MSSRETAHFDTVIYEKRGPVCHLVLDRPEVVNAYNIQMRDDLHLALGAAKDDPEVKAIVLRGAGDRGFCAGADLTEFGTAPSQTVARSVRWERDVWGLFLSMSKPMVAALHGYVIGSGLEMACLCDIRLAAEGARFRMPEAALGMVPAAGGTQTLPRLIGPGPALDVLLTNRVVSAEEAYRLGLVHRLVPEDRLAQEADGLARELASRPAKAMATAKEALRAGHDLALEQGLALERRLVAGLVAEKR